MATTAVLCWRGFRLVCFASVAIVTSRAFAFQASMPVPPELEQRIAQDLDLTKVGERTGVEPLSLGRLWAHLAVDYEEAAEFAKAEAAYNRALQIFERTPDAAKDYAIALDNLGSLYLASHNDEAAEKCRRRALAAREGVGDRLEIARGKALLAEVYLARRKYKEAQQTAAEAYDAMVGAKDPDSSELVSTLITLTFSSSMHGQHAYAVERGREAESLALAALPADSLLTGEVRMALGYAEWKAGMADGPDEEMREGVRILRKWVTPGHPYLLGAMTQYRNYLKDAHRAAEAKEIAEEEKALMSNPPNTCANCTVSVYGLRAR
jgi:tetratricopeptide (TPR) repeat protein